MIVVTKAEFLFLCRAKVFVRATVNGEESQYLFSELIDAYQDADGSIDDLIERRFDAEIHTENSRDA